VSTMSPGVGEAPVWSIRRLGRDGTGRNQLSGYYRWGFSIVPSLGWDRRSPRSFSVDPHATRTGSGRPNSRSPRGAACRRSDPFAHSALA
jgi:hypothetical protein